jgi:hypothetical protein
MAGLDPASHVSASTGIKTWMPGTRPGMAIQCNRKMIYRAAMSMSGLQRE